MWWTIGKRVLRVFVVFWMTAVGGILGANLLAIIGTQFFVSENKVEYVQPWSHAGITAWSLRCDWREKQMHWERKSISMSF